MFERLTEAARAAVTEAQSQARGLGSGTVGPEHLLLGVLDRGDGVAVRVLADLGISTTSVRAGIAAASEAEARADADALRAIGIDLDEVRARVEAGFGVDALAGRPRPRRGLLRRFAPSHLPLEPGARRAIENSLRQALALRSGSIGTEHLLLGLLAVEDDRVDRLLVDPDGLTAPRAAADQVRERLLAALAPAR